MARLNAQPIMIVFLNVEEYCTAIANEIIQTHLTLELELPVMDVYRIGRFPM